MDQNSIHGLVFIIFDNLFAFNNFEQVIPRCTLSTFHASKDIH